MTTSTEWRTGFRVQISVLKNGQTDVTDLVELYLGTFESLGFSGRGSKESMEMSL